MSNSAVCWHCGASLAELTPPLSRFDVCKQCHAELHVCLLCQFYDPIVAKQCREPIAEEVRDKRRANFCDYFTVRLNAYQPASVIATQQARSELNTLFGGTSSSADTGHAQSAADAAQAALRDLFGSKKP